MDWEAFDICIQEMEEVREERLWEIHQRMVVCLERAGWDCVVAAGRATEARPHRARQRKSKRRETA